MVKNPPCEQYDGPHISYQRNQKTFCRRKNITHQKKEIKKTPPCHQYSGKHIIYIRNEKPYCRRVPDKDHSSLVKSKSKTNIFDNCVDLPDTKINNYAELMNINTSDKEKSDLCLQISNILRDDSRKVLTTNIYYQTTPEDVKHISQLLNISLKDSHGEFKNLEQMFVDICQKITKYSSKKMRSLLEDLLQEKSSCSVQTGYIITKIIKNILYPNRFPKKSPMLITNQLDRKLISLKKKGVLSNTTEQELLRESLHSKLCHCIKSMLIHNKFKKEVLNRQTKYNPYAICTQSVYKNRGFRVPKKSVRKCPNDYDWYRKLDFITGKNKKSSQVSVKKKSKDNVSQQGGNVTDNCTQSLEEVKMMKWPNIYANTDGWRGSGWP